MLFFFLSGAQEQARSLPYTLANLPPHAVDPYYRMASMYPPGSRERYLSRLITYTLCVCVCVHSQNDDFLLNGNIHFNYSLELELERDKRERDERERQLRERELREMELREKMKHEMDLKPPGKM